MTEYAVAIFDSEEIIFRFRISKLSCFLGFIYKAILLAVSKL
jgi:hypothetical protein